MWEALLTVADAAGGDWPKRARVSAVTLVTESRGSTPSLGVRLLADLHEIFGDADAVFTETILDRLHALDEAPWPDLRGKPLDARGLANRLRPYGVGSKTVRIGEATAKGYSRDDLHDPWRYLPGVSLSLSPKESVTSVTSDTEDRLWEDWRTRRTNTASSRSVRRGRS